MEPNLERARQTAMTAHGVVIKLKEMGLPDDLDGDLASLSTDLGDLWGAQKTLSERLETLLRSDGSWDLMGDYLVDLRDSIDHIGWHLKSVRRPLNRVTRFAYRQALKPRLSQDPE